MIKNIIKAISDFIEAPITNEIMKNSKVHWNSDVTKRIKVTCFEEGVKTNFIVQNARSLANMFGINIHAIRMCLEGVNGIQWESHNRMQFEYVVMDKKTHLHKSSYSEDDVTDGYI
jgi:hypothetical protein